MKAFLFFLLISTAPANANVQKSLNDLLGAVNTVLEPRMKEDYANRVHQYFVMSFLDRLTGMRNYRNLNHQAIDRFSKDSKEIDLMLNSFETSEDKMVDNIIMLNHKMDDLRSSLDTYARNLISMREMAQSLRIDNCEVATSHDIRIKRTFKEFRPTQVGGYLNFFPGSGSRIRSWNPLNPYLEMGTENERQILESSLALVSYPLAATYNLIKTFWNSDTSQQEADTANKLIGAINELLARLDSPEVRSDLIRSACQRFETTFIGEKASQIESIIGYTDIHGGQGNNKYKELKLLLDDYEAKHAEKKQAIKELEAKVAHRLDEAEKDLGNVFASLLEDLTLRVQKSARYARETVKPISKVKQSILEEEILRRQQRRSAIVIGDQGFENTSTYLIYRTERKNSLKDLGQEAL